MEHEPSEQRKRRHPNSTDESGGTRRWSSTEIMEQTVDPNFEELARQYPAFRKAWEETRARQKEKGPHTSFSSCVTQQFTIALTRALLQTYFQLKLPYLEEDHLCPPIPNRFYYLLWIHRELLNHGDNIVPSFGLDIGAGASCIYPLLAARHFRSRMVTAEIDPKAAALAKSNVQANHLSNFIQVLDVAPSYTQQQQQQQQGGIAQLGGPLHRAIDATAALQQHQQQSFAQPLQFVMTNPPFYDPNDQGIHIRAGDGRARTHMTVSEGIYPGGEVGFVTDMIADSLRLTSSQSYNNNIITSKTWYSSMLGRKTSLIKLEKLLMHLMGPAHVRVTEYGPGQYTRWFLAWTLEQPLANDPFARVAPHDHDLFAISLATLMEQEGRSMNINDGMHIVVQRVVAYCESSPGGWDLSVENVSGQKNNGTTAAVLMMIQESMPLAISYYVDEGLSDVEMPSVLLEALKGGSNHLFLPDEGHFSIQVDVTCNSTNGNAFAVQLTLFRHSSRGAKAIEKIRNTLEGDVCRTNRKWRKIRQRQQDHGASQ